MKPIVFTLILVGFLQLTGWWGSASAMAQMLVMKTGILNVDVEAVNAPADFDYAFSIKDLSGNKIAFDQFKGKVLFINLWATWCGPCKAEMPGIQSLSEKLKDEPIDFVMLSVDKEGATSKVKTYIEKNLFTFPVFIVNGQLKEQLPEQLQVPSIPTTFIVSKDGKILMKEVGTRNYDTNKMVKFLKKETAK